MQQQSIQEQKDMIESLDEAETVDTSALETRIAALESTTSTLSSKIYCFIIYLILFICIIFGF